jgi:hypothetical protein
MIVNPTQRAKRYWVCGTVRGACAAIHSRALFLEENLPNKRTEPFGAVICTRHIWPFRTVVNIVM